MVKLKKWAFILLCFNVLFVGFITVVIVFGLDDLSKKWIILSLSFNALLVILFTLVVVFIFRFLKAMAERIGEQRASQFETLAQPRGGVVFLGDSITHNGLWSEWFPDITVINRGIGGDTTQDVLDRVEPVYQLEPEKLFLMIGVNDLNDLVHDKDISATLDNYEKLFNGFEENIPDTKIFLQSVLPINDDQSFVKNSEIHILNTTLQKQADQRGYTYIDVGQALSDSEGALDKHYSNDGIHLMGSGYKVWTDVIRSHVSTD